MEDDDDEFGDLYTDVLLPFTSSSASQPHSAVETAQSLNRPIDLNIKSDNEGSYAAPHSISTFNFANSSQNRALPFDPKKTAAELITAGSSDSSLNLRADDKLKNQELGEEAGLVGLGNNWASDSRGRTDSRVLESGGDVKLQKKAFEDPNLMDESGIDVVVDERDDKDDVFVGEDEILTGKSENFDIEEVNTGIGDLGSEPIIPGLSITGVSGAAEYQGDVNIATRDEATGEGDDWESDSEDDLQIVLNDNNHIPMPMDRAGVVGTDDDDEDGDPLVIVADTDVADPNHQQTDEQEWGEDAAQGADGERKESGDAAKVNGVAVAPKIGYNNHGYHPFHSQFKYVRPGAAPIPGSAPVAPGGTVGQVRPPVNMGPMAGRGRGDWRPTGIKNAAPMQKNFHPAFGMPGWGNNTSGRGSGLEFTLPSHKTIFDVEVESFEEKPWRLPGIDISDFFNFSLNEDSWKEYCKQLEQHRLEATMQSKIRVYESGRTEQEYDPDLPPELAAAAGMNEVSSENVNLGKTDAGQNDLTKGPARARPPLPTGRAIQVESGYGERLPSIDTRPPRIRDSDAIIEIVLQDFGDDDSFPGNDVTEQPENDRVGEDVGEHEIEEDIGQDVAKQFDRLSPAYNSKKREPVGRRTPLLNSVCDNISEGVGTVPLHPEVPGEYNPDSREKTPVYRGRNLGNSHEDRRRKGRTPDRSPSKTPSGGTLDRRFCDNQKEGSVESMGVKHSPSLSRSSAGDPGVEHGGSMQDERALADGSSGIEKEEMILNETTDTLKDDNLMNSVKKQKLHSRVEQTCLQEVDDTEDLKAARSSENSRARSGSSRDYQKLHDGIEEEVVQDGRSTRMRNTKRPLCDDEPRVRKQIRDERLEVERHRMAVKGREDSYSRRDRDPNSAHYPNIKTEGIDRLKERDTSDGAWQWRDGDPYGRRTRAEDTKKRERGEEMGSRHRTKARESERGDKDEHLQLRKQLDNGSWRGHHDKDMGSRHRERDDNLRSRYENIDDIHSKRRKEDEHIKREHAEKEEIVHGHRENTTRRKRERDDVMDQWKRDDQARIRDDDHHSVRHKEESWFQREKGDRQRDRDELHMPKQPHEESLSKREREGRGVGIRSVRAAEDKAWVSHARGKDEHKGSDRDYQFKETGRQSEQLKRRDRVEDGSSDRDYQFKETGRQSEQLKRRDRVEDGSSQHRGREDVFARGNQPSNDEKKLRLERATTRNDHTVNISDTHKMNEKKHKGNVRKSKETEGGDNNSLGSSKRIQEDHKGQINETVFLKGASEQENGEQKITVGHHSSRKHKDDASSDDEQQDSRRGRSKLERWTSHKERDFSIGAKSSSSLKVKEIERHNDAASSLTSKLPDESSKMIESSDHQHPFGNEKDAGNPENKNANAKVMEDKHLDTVAKLKKRSERFKLPMPSEKDAVAVKKMESEPLPSAQIETNADSEVKLERPARRRRWTSN